MGVFRQLKDLRTATATGPMVGTARVISCGAPEGPGGDLPARVELQFEEDADSYVVVTSIAIPRSCADRVFPGAALSVSMHGSDPSGAVIEWGDGPEFSEERNVDSRPSDAA